MPGPPEPGIPLYLEIPLSEFENLHEHIRILQERVKKLEEELRGYAWGESNRISEEHSLVGEPGGEPEDE